MFTQVQHLHHDDHQVHSVGLQPAADSVHGDPHLPAAATAVTEL